MVLRRVMLSVACAWAVLSPGVALACPVCFSAQNEENRAAFVAMTAFLTLLPLGMLGLGLGWVWRRLQQQDGNAGADDATAESVATPVTSISPPTV